GWRGGGAAAATVLAQWLGAVWFLRLLAPHWLGFGAVKGRDLLPLLSAGWAILIRTGALLAALTVATASAARIGTSAVAAHQIVMQIWLLLALLVDALAVAGQALVGRYLGEGDELMVVKVVKRLTIWGLVSGLGLALMLLAIGPLLEPVFGVTSEVAALAVGVLPLVASLQPLGAVLFVGDGVFLGASRFRFLAVTSALASVGSIAVTLMFDGRRTDLTGVWIGVSVLLALRMIPQVLSYARHGSVVVRERPAT
ncbi:MAG: MATE family efflux transporter, partial [Acidimicrobiia bacterium]|nr:MATE family efflux transporter [Acidimicrobiia bacterium]